MIQRVTFYQQNLTSDFLTEVNCISDSLLNHLNSTEILNKIKNANQPGNSSSMIQNTFIDYAINLGFTSEAKGLFNNAKNQLLRPDYYMSLNNGKGILLEVERGKVTINNMDLLDMWKCHICQCADVLFLMVPLELRQNSTMRPRKEFNTVSKRLSAFFENGSYTNVKVLHIFGY